MSRAACWRVRREDGGVAELIWPGKHDRPTGVNDSRFHLRTVETVGVGGWVNRLIEGDRAEALRALLPEFAGQIDLVYVDPPFATGNDFEMASGQGESRVAYCDSWDSLDAYLAWLYETLILLHELLKADGSLYVHLAHHIGHYARRCQPQAFCAQARQPLLLHEVAHRLGVSPPQSSLLHDASLWFSQEQL